MFSTFLKNIRIKRKQIILVVLFAIVGAVVGCFSSPRKYCGQVVCQIREEGFRHYTELGNLIISDSHLSFLSERTQELNVTNESIRSCISLDINKETTMFTVTFSSIEEEIVKNLTAIFSNDSISYIGSQMSELKNNITIESNSFYFTHVAKYVLFNCVLTTLSFCALSYLAVFVCDIFMTKENKDGTN